MELSSPPAWFEASETKTYSPPCHLLTLEGTAGEGMKATKNEKKSDTPHFLTKEIENC